MKALEEFIRPAQKELFKKLLRMYGEKAICRKGKFILVRGEVPILLIAHLDTVHKHPVRNICRSRDGNILMSPQGIGGDDRCGVYGISKIYRLSGKKPWLLFTCDEETGGKGANAFCTAYRENALPNEIGEMKMLIELDRKGRNDAVYYSCANPDFETYITSKGFKTDFGSFSDISIIAPELGVAAVNLSCGYYHAHTTHEYIDRKQLERTLKRVLGIVSDVSREDFPRYEYIDAELDAYAYWEDLYGEYHGLETWKDTEMPKELPDEYKCIYDELLDLYSPEELAHHLKRYGVRGLRELYLYEFGAV